MSLLVMAVKISYCLMFFADQDMGIIVGSLGKYKKEEDVVGLTVINCTFTRTSNSVIIKI